MNSQRQQFEQIVLRDLYQQKDTFFEDSTPKVSRPVSPLASMFRGQGGSQDSESPNNKEPQSPTQSQQSVTKSKIQSPRNKKEGGGGFPLICENAKTVQKLKIKQPLDQKVLSWVLGVLLIVFVIGFFIALFHPSKGNVSLKEGFGNIDNIHRVLSNPKALQNPDAVVFLQSQVLQHYTEIEQIKNGLSILLKESYRKKKRAIYDIYNKINRTTDLNERQKLFKALELVRDGMIENMVESVDEKHREQVESIEEFTHKKADVEDTLKRQFGKILMQQKILENFTTIVTKYADKIENEQKQSFFANMTKQLSNLQTLYQQLNEQLEELETYHENQKEYIEKLLSEIQDGLTISDSNKDQDEYGIF